MRSERGWLVGVLAASLLVNVFLGGVLVGRGFAVHRGPGPTPAPPSALVPPRHVGALPDDQKRLFQTAMRAHREVIQTARRGHKAARDRLEADIAAPTFDRAVVTADFDALHRSNQEVDTATGDALIEALSGLSAVSRAALVAHNEAPAATAPGPGKSP